MDKPNLRPANPNFSSGPCAKRPGWSPDALKDALLGRSHRAPEGKARLEAVIEQSKAVLRMPADYRLGIVPASDTGAVELALWSLLGPRGVHMLAWESFGSTWVADVLKQLKLPDVAVLEAPYGDLPDLSAVDFDRDVVFTWNGTTGGVKVPDGAWIPADRKGLTICDATSAAFAMDLPWDKLDVVTWSWQKVLGGEAQHGMLALSPRAVERLAWAESIGGLPALMARSEANLKAVADWVATNPNLDFLASDPATRSNTSICLKLTAPWVASQPDGGLKVVKRVAALVAENDAGEDIAGHRDAPAHLRIWGGATVETDDIRALLPWIDWALEQVRVELGA
jgi:phosphoserine aminotransferase